MVAEKTDSSLALMSMLTKVFIKRLLKMFICCRMTRARLGILSEEKYDTILDCVQGTFKVPIKERTDEQKKGVFIYRRWKENLKVNSYKRLTCHGKLVAKDVEIKNLIRGTYRENLGIGIRALYYRLQEKYYGVTQEMIKKTLYACTSYHKQRPRFLNKPKPKTITATSPGERWQIDLIEMRRDAVTVHGDTYRFILQVIDVHSRFLITRPLVKKSSAVVARALEDIIYQHDAPHIIQCDNGSEFKGEVIQLCKRHFIRVIHSSPYHPQSQGKCERANRTLKNKIRFAMRERQGFNWVEGLQKLTYAINKSTKRILGNKSPFQIYYSKDGGSKSIKKCLKNIAKLSHRKAIRKVGGTVSVYNKGEKVLIRYPFRKSRIPSRRYILEGTIIKRSRDAYKYLVKFQNPSGQENVDWVGVEHITSCTFQKEMKKRKRNTCRNNCQSTATKKRQKKKHRKNFYIVLTHENNLKQFEADGNEIKVAHDPIPNGNCQFDAVAHQLGLLGIYTSAEDLRLKAVDHLTRHRENYESFVSEDFEEYLGRMVVNGTYGDHLTLLALMRELNCQCLVLSTSGIDHTALVSNDGVYYRDMNTITLGHFPESAGMHYVSLAVDDVAFEMYIRAANKNSEEFHENDSGRASEKTQDRIVEPPGGKS